MNTSIKILNNNKKIVALVLARSGSKGIIDKNIKLYKGIPLLAHSIKIGVECPYISDVYLSTDSAEYLEIGALYGAKKMDLRSREIADDLSPDSDAFHHFLQWYFREYGGVYPDIIVQLRPTYPNRSLSVLNDCIERFLSEYETYDSLRTVIKLDKTPYKMYYIREGVLIPYFAADRDPRFKEPFNQARQNFPDTYLHNGCIDIVKTSIILGGNDVISGTRIMPYIMNDDEVDDIDTLNDFIKSENKSIINI